MRTNASTRYVLLAVALGGIAVTAVVGYRWFVSGGVGTPCGHRRLVRHGSTARDPESWLTWSLEASARPLAWGDAVAACRARGMRLPTWDEVVVLEALSGENLPDRDHLDECVFSKERPGLYWTSTRPARLPILQEAAVGTRTAFWIASDLVGSLDRNEGEALPFVCVRVFPP